MHPDANFWVALKNCVKLYFICFTLVALIYLLVT
jgi:hypothetical protein